MGVIRRLAFDIETQADPAKIACMADPEVALGNTKDPAKVAEKIAEARVKQIDKAALDPHLSRVMCISVGQRDGIHPDSEIKSETTIRKHPFHDDYNVDDAESSLLVWFWDRVRLHKHFVTFNGAGFDLPFLLRRSMLLGVRPCRIECGKYRVTEPGCEHLDLYQLLSEAYGCYSASKQNLHFYAKEILKEEPTYGEDLEKGALGRMFEAGQHDKISEVCAWDCSATLRIGEIAESVYA